MDYLASQKSRIQKLDVYSFIKCENNFSIIDLTFP